MTRPSNIALVLAVSLASSAAAAQVGYYPGNDGYRNGEAGAGYYGDGYGPPVIDRNGQLQGAQYDYARVLRVDPVFQPGGYGGTAPQARCRTQPGTYTGNDPYYGNGYRSDGEYVGNGDYRNDGYQDYGRNSGTATGQTVATVIGGVIGAALGSQVGGGSARYATSALGTMLGGVAGNQIYRNTHAAPRVGTVTVCDPVPAYGNGYYPTDGGGISAYDITYEYAGREYVTRTDYNPGDRIRVRVDVRPE